jgi:hypothetical protein
VAAPWPIPGLSRNRTACFNTAIMEDDFRANTSRTV